MIPSYIVEIGDFDQITEEIENRIVAVSAGQTSGTTGNSPATFTDAPRIMVPIEIHRSSDPRDSTFQVTTAVFDLLDHGGAASAIINTNIVGKFVSLSINTVWDAAWSNCKPLFWGFISDIEHRDKAFRITAKDASSMIDRTIFNVAKTTVASDILAADTSISLVDASGFAQPGGWVLIDDELILYGSAVDAGPTWTLSSLVRGYLDTTVADHDEDAAAGEVIVISGNPIGIFYNVLNGTYPKSFDAPGLTGLLDAAELAVQETAIGISYQMQFAITEPVNAKQWLEDQILKPIGAYPYDSCNTNGGPAFGGKLSVKLFDSPGAAADSFGDEHVLQRPHWRGNFPKTVNIVNYYFDEDPSNGRFRSSYQYRDAGLIALYGEKPLDIESGGLRAALSGTATLIADRAAAIVDRFGLQLPTLECEALFAKYGVTVADEVSVSFDQVANLSNDDVDFTDPCEIIEANYLIEEGKTRFTLLAYTPA